jgi:hypothetical protein
MNKNEAELHHYLGLHEWKKFDREDLEYRYCELCCRLEYEYNGKWHKSKLPAYGFESTLYIKTRAAAQKAGVCMP